MPDIAIDDLSVDNSTYTKDGVDLTLIRYMLSLTPAERFALLQNYITSIQRLKNAKLGTEFTIHSEHTS